MNFKTEFCYSLTYTYTDGKGQEHDQQMYANIYRRGEPGAVLWEPDIDLHPQFNLPGRYRTKAKAEQWLRSQAWRFNRRQAFIEAVAIHSDEDSLVCSNLELLSSH